MESGEDRRPPLYEVHDERGARFTEFGGWEMPVEFDSIREEHESVREDVGIFDVSHMGEVTVTGPDAEELMNRLVTNDVSALDRGGSLYAAVTDDEGVMLDDTVVYRLPEDSDEEFLFVPNAGHDEEMTDRWMAHRDDWHLDASINDVTEEWAMFALQGPEAEDLAGEVVEDPIVDLGRFSSRFVQVEGVRCLASRTGYTGEDGFEFVVPWDDAETVWSAFDCQPCGLGARDTLRMEAGFLLSGQDFHPEENPRTPYEGGIGFAVKLDTEFVGRDALERQKEEGVEEKLVGFRLVDRGVPRHGYTIETPDGEEIGEVTSGTMSPTLEEPIGLGYVLTEYADDGTRIRVLVRGEPKKARIEALPFVE
ncbi:glycine cleavage system protein T [Halobacteriales archaeon QS_1_68_20]|nr:MAG: glycine cleavage system protein T [Halobacteriales archaeon QS_1_68_20]